MTLDELRALLGEASEAPWDYRYEMVDELHGSALGNVLTRGERNNYWIGMPDSDGPLIAALRNHAEALLELWEAARVVRERLNRRGDLRGGGDLALLVALDRLEAT